MPPPSVPSSQPTTTGLSRTGFQISGVQPAEQKQLTPEERGRLQNLIIDSEGRTVDKRTGEIVQIASRTPTLKANIKVAQQHRRHDQKGGSTDLFASGFASTISNASGILTSASSSIMATAMSSAASSAASSIAAEQSEKFFDPRLK